MKSRVRTSVIVVHNNKLLTFFAVDPTSGKEYYFLPGGAIEADETAPEAAERETLEETGFEIQVDIGTAIDKEYVFHWNGEDYDCLTIFYRAHLKSIFQKPVNDATYNKGVHWIELSDVQKKMSYNKEIFEAIQELIAL